MEIAAGGNPDLYTEMFSVTTTVMNTGQIRGATVVQLYVSFNSTDLPADSPVKVLRGFEKVDLQPHSQTSVQFLLTRRDLSFWNVTAQDWQIPFGTLNLMVGFSSRDVKQRESIELAKANYK